jgi:hypothetical protein
MVSDRVANSENGIRYLMARIAALDVCTIWAANVTENCIESKGNSEDLHVLSKSNWCTNPNSNSLSECRRLRTEFHGTVQLNGKVHLESKFCHRPFRQEQKREKAWQSRKPPIAPPDDGSIGSNQNIASSDFAIWQATFLDFSIYDSCSYLGYSIHHFTS